MIKNNLLTGLLCLLVSSTIFCQKSGIRLLDLDVLEQGKYNKVELEDDEGQEIGKLIFQKRVDGKTDVSVSLNSPQARGIRIDYVKNMEVYSSETVNSGPAPEGNLYTRKVIHSEILAVPEQGFGIFSGILVVAYCCVQITVGSSTTYNSDGTTTTTPSWEIGFDCDCFSFSSILIGSNGETHEEVDEVIISVL